MLFCTGWSLLLFGVCVNSVVFCFLLCAYFYVCLTIFRCLLRLIGSVFRGFVEMVVYC